jgi:hypothetical protein
VGEERGERRAVVAEFRVAVPGASSALPRAVGLDQHILWFSKLLLPLVSQPAKVGPVPLFALREPLD